MENENKSKKVLEIEHYKKIYQSKIGPSGEEVHIEFPEEQQPDNNAANL